MPQFRLTEKFAADCKIKQLHEPISSTHLLDDWFIDRMIVYRKKVAMITHAKSTFTFFIPCAEAGSAKGIFLYFKNQLKQLFQQNSLPALALEVEALFSEEITFVKTADRKILGHMIDFKRCAEPNFLGEPIPFDWHETTEHINNMPIQWRKNDWQYPIDLFNTLLGINLPKIKR